MTRLIRLAFLTLLAVTGFCTQGLAQSAVTAPSQVPLIEPAQLHVLLTSGIRVTLLDVRQPEEFSQGHIQGAILMPLDTLASAYTKLPKTGKLVVYCRSGHRSAQAVQFLLQNGYGNAVSLNGGFTAWTAANY
ncbi:MAG: rhodanese-like domain-containing protein [Rhizomicrobium sp.]|jgi:rhodanese-related sulfurtransferase